MRWKQTLMQSLDSLRRRVARHGRIRSQPESGWTGVFPLPRDLASFYRDVGPDNVTFARWDGQFFIPSLATLWDFQAGYRWNGNTGEAIDDWDDDWLVVADREADPFILSRRTGTVSFALHGGGEWRPRPAFKSVSAMVARFASRLAPATPLLAYAPSIQSRRA